MNDNQPVQAERDAPGAWIMVVLLLLTWVMAYIDRMILLLLVPSIKASLGVSDTQIALLYGLAFSIVFVLAGLFMGRLVDRTNRRNLLLLALLGWSIGAVASGLSHSFAGLFAGRMLIGVSQAALAPASFSLVADLFPAERRGRPISLMIAAATFGSALSNIAGGVLLQMLTKVPPVAVPLFGTLAPWQLTLVLAGLPGFLLALLFLLVREPARRHNAAGALVEGNAITYLRAHAMLFALLFLAVAFMYIVGYGLSAWYPALFMRTVGLSPAVTGLTMGGITLLAAVIAGVGGGWLSDRFAASDPGGGRLRMARLFLVIEFVALIPLIAPHNLPMVLLSFALFATLSTTVSAIGYSVLPDLVPNECRGQITAVYQLVANLLGLGFGPTLIALVTDHVLHDESRLGFAMLVVGLPCIAISALLMTLLIPHARALRKRMEGLAADR